MTKLRTSLVNLHERPKTKIPKGKNSKKYTKKDAKNGLELEICTERSEETEILNNKFSVNINLPEPEISTKTPPKPQKSQISQKSQKSQESTKSHISTKPKVAIEFLKNNKTNLALLTLLCSNLIFFKTVQTGNAENMIRLNRKIRELDSYNAKLEGLIQVFEDNGVITRAGRDSDSKQFEDYEPMQADQPMVAKRNPYMPGSEKRNGCSDIGPCGLEPTPALPETPENIVDFEFTYKFVHTGKLPQISASYSVLDNDFSANSFDSNDYKAAGTPAPKIFRKDDSSYFEPMINKMIEKKFDYFGRMLEKNVTNKVGRRARKNVMGKVEALLEVHSKLAMRQNDEIKLLVRNNTARIHAVSMKVESCCSGNNGFPLVSLDDLPPRLPNLAAYAPEDPIDSLLANLLSNQIVNENIMSASNSNSTLPPLANKNDENTELCQKLCDKTWAFSNSYCYKPYDSGRTQLSYRRSRQTCRQQKATITRYLKIQDMKDAVKMPNIYPDTPKGYWLLKRRKAEGEGRRCNYVTITGILKPISCKRRLPLTCMKKANIVTDNSISEICNGWQDI